ncbi:type VI secretion system-associated FHA domain protein TagH [Novosphingobium sp. ERN07]|uniref:type VI secretion system-associated FHA domain protein TagH n=1 Tax=Novosphingobium sp. ERN07 TaxID=2726187 RepID=UPI00197F9051|nr:type VI secretion system-associated FHA domain protein TagH [Novosphingobium sp. ERN07]
MTLTIRNADRLDNGSPLSLVLDRRGALIGRAATSDWCLPDPSLHVSSRHCEVRFSGGGYELIDHSTNGTFVDGQQARLAGPHPISQGDVFRVGPFEIVAALDDASAALAAERNSDPAPTNWKGWTSGNEASAPAAQASSWDARPAGSAISGTGPMSQSWAAPPTAASSPGGWGAPPPPPAAPSPVAPQAEPPSSGWGPSASAAAPPPASGWGAPTSSSDGSGPSTWGAPAQAPLTPASDWSSPIAAPPPPAADDIWGKFAQSNVVDWARGGFGGTAQPATPAFTPPPPAAPPPPMAAPAPAPVAAASPAPIAAPPPAAPQGAGLATLAQSAGVNADRLQAGEAQTLGMAGNLLRRLVAGMVVMLEARARAKSQLGAQGTSLEFDGNNPLKFARTPEQALEQLLNSPQRGFMDSERAVEDAFKDLQAHQMATLKAMQGALRSTLDRFSPRAIRARAEQGGILSRILPGAREAALWAAYEREFSGVAQGSDEAFMEMFAKEFRRAYEEIARQR